MTGRGDGPRTGPGPAAGRLRADREDRPPTGRLTGRYVLREGAPR